MSHAPLLRRIELAEGEALTESLLARSGGVDAAVVATAASIVEDVRTRGDVAVLEYTAKFDGVTLEAGALRVTAEEIETAFEAVDMDLLDALEVAAERIDAYHRRQVEQSWFTTEPGGIMLGQQVTAIERVGIYVPGGRAQYPSSVLMNAIPAAVAGVDEIIMVAPPGPDGTIAPMTLVAAAIAGVDGVYKVGGAQAIGALAYGTDTIPRVDKIVGPGNAYVAAAKKLVMGDVGIDMIAGPSEVCVLADDTAVPAFIAIDLMAQAEHDPRAAVYLVTDDPSLPELVEDALAVLLEESPRADITRPALENNSVAIVCETFDDALAAVNAIAPEHLELQVDSPYEILGSIRNAGAIFMGTWTSEAVGDYIAGPNHVLPTGGTARFSSPLSVSDFTKRSSVISYSFEALEAHADAVVTIADNEGLWAHARSVEMRIDAAYALFGDDDDDDEGDLDDEGDEGDLDGGLDAPDELTAAENDDWQE